MGSKIDCIEVHSKWDISRTTYRTIKTKVSLELVLNCATKEEFEEKAFESLAGYARTHDLEIGPIYIDWSMPAEEYHGKT